MTLPLVALAQGFDGDRQQSRPIQMTPYTRVGAD
jgi:hypothetical protein